MVQSTPTPAGHPWVAEGARRIRFGIAWGAQDPSSSWSETARLRPDGRGARPRLVLGDRPPERSRERRRLLDDAGGPGGLHAHDPLRSAGELHLLPTSGPAWPGWQLTSTGSATGGSCWAWASATTSPSSRGSASRSRRHPNVSRCSTRRSRSCAASGVPSRSPSKGVTSRAGSVHAARSGSAAVRPLLIAGGGERGTLPRVARYADASNFGAHRNIGGAFTMDDVARKLDVLQARCGEQGRPYDSVLRTHTTMLLFLAETQAALQAKLASVPREPTRGVRHEHGGRDAARCHPLLPGARSGRDALLHRLRPSGGP